jgi:opacity protein-like surface antigen
MQVYKYIYLLLYLRGEDDMLKKFIIILVSLILVSSAFAVEKEFPTIPDDCFDVNIYCSNSEVVKKVITVLDVDGKLVTKESSVVNVKIFLVLGSETDFIKLDTIKKRFFDFNSWEKYAKDYKKVVRYKKSFDMGDTIIGNETIKRHYVNYKMKGPFGKWFKVRTVGYYKGLEAPIQDANYSAIFENQLKGTFKVEGEDVLKGAEGFNYTAGEFHIKYDEDEDVHLVYYTANVKPGVNLFGAEHVAKKHVEAGILALLKGMFKTE